MMVAEDDLREMRREIEEVRDHVEDMSHIQALQVQADGRVRALVLEYFESGSTAIKREIYLAVNGARGVRDIADVTGRAPATVSKYGGAMIERGILGASIIGGRKVFHYTRLERAIHLSNLVRDLERG